MPLYMFKKIFKNTMVEQLKQSIKNHIRLHTYNGISKHHTIRYMCSIYKI